jgi:hypothetical protein
LPQSASVSSKSRTPHSTLGRVEDAAEVLLRLAEAFADDLARVDAVEAESELVREHLRRHRLAQATGAGEEHVNARQRNPERRAFSEHEPSST